MAQHSGTGRSHLHLTLAPYPAVSMHVESPDLQGGRQGPSEGTPQDPEAHAAAHYRYNANTRLTGSNSAHGLHTSRCMSKKNSRKVQRRASMPAVTAASGTTHVRRRSYSPQHHTLPKCCVQRDLQLTCILDSRNLSENSPCHSVQVRGMSSKKVEPLAHLSRVPPPHSSSQRHTRYKCARRHLAYA